MPNSIGTRIQATATRERVDQGGDSRSHTRDIGMSKRVVSTLTMTASSARIAGSNGDFTNFAVEDPILLQGGVLNNGSQFRVTGIDVTNHAFLTVTPAPKDESSIAGTVRTV